MDETRSDVDPLRQFERWLGEALAARVPEPNAMTLATVGADLRPSTRIVLVKGVDARGLVWYTNYDSRKGHELAGNPYGTYVQDEPCIHCGAAMLAPATRTLASRVLAKGAVTAMRAQAPFVQQRPNWIHMLLEKRPADSLRRFPWPSA